MNQDLAASLLVRNINNVWIDDNLVSRCHMCNKEFSLLIRKHHCRNCGNIFCYMCTNQYIIIPECIIDRPPAEDYWNLSYYISSLKSNEERVCKTCYDIILGKISSSTDINNILSEPVDIDYIKNLPDTHSNSKHHYYDHLRNIQYYLPNHKYTNIDINLLIHNSAHFSKHSKYLVHLIKSINWNQPTYQCVQESVRQSAKQPTNQSVQQSTNQSVRQSTNQSVKQSTNQAVKQSTNQSLTQTTSQSVRQSFNQSVTPSTYHSVRQTSNQSVRQTSNQSMRQTSNQSVRQTKQECTLYDKLIFIKEILESQKSKMCNDLFCTRTCREELYCDDCINILYSNANNIPDPLLEYLFNIISNSPEQIILCHLSFFISLIKNNNTNKKLQLLLYNLLTDTLKKQYHTYWFLNNAIKNANMQEIKNIKNFIGLFDTHLVKIMNKEYFFFSGLIENLSNVKEYLLQVFTKFEYISLPYEPTIKLVAIDGSDIEIKSSFTKPVVIPFITSDGTKIKLLFKKESVMNDVTVLNLMTLCDIILKENLNEKFNVIVYPVMPLTYNSGMIEIIDDAETVHAINNSKKTILKHIIERNEHRVIGDILDNYMYSLVSYTLHSYLLGLGDRHLQNIMISDNGSIFHIDFGYILGTDAYPLTVTDIKLNTEMLDVIGGTNSSRYHNYLDLCAMGIVILRKYFNMFFILLSQYDHKFKNTHVENFVMARFQPRQVDIVVISELMTVIKKSNNAYSDCIRDFLHHHTQEKTVQNGVGQIGQVILSTYDVVKKFTK